MEAVKSGVAMGTEITLAGDIAWHRARLHAAPVEIGAVFALLHHGVDAVGGGFSILPEHALWRPTGISDPSALISDL